MSRKSLVLTVVAVVAAGLLIFAFIQGRAEFAKEQEREAPVKSPSRVSTVNRETVVSLDFATMDKSGIQVAAMTVETSTVEQRAFAAVLGVQDLADTRNAYATAKAQRDKAQASLDASRKDYQRLKQLHDDDRNVSDKAFQVGVAALATEQANLQAAQVALQGAQNGGVQRYGDVIAGWLASDAPILKRVLQQRDVLIQVTFPLAAANTTPPKTIRVQVADNVFVPATLVARSPRIDPRIQGVGYFYVASGNALVPGMNVPVFLPTKSEANGVLVPQSALVWWQGKSWIYVQRSPGQFARVEVLSDQPVANGFIVRQGLNANDQVVVTGAQLLLSEEFRSQIHVGEEGAAK